MADCPWVSAYPSLTGWFSRLYTWGKICSPIESCYLRKGNPKAVFPGKQWFSTQPTNSAPLFYDQYCLTLPYMGLPRWFSGKESAPSRSHRRCGFDPWVGRSPGEGNPTRSSILARIIPWTEEPGGLLSMRSQRDRHVLVTEHTSMLHYTPEMKLMNSTHILKKKNQNIALAVTSRRNKKLTCRILLRVKITK